MADHSKAQKHFQLAITASKAGDTKLARHHAGHAFNALNDRMAVAKRPGTGFAGSPAPAPKMPPAPPSPMMQEGGEPEGGDVPVQTGGGLMARLKAFGAPK